MKELKVWKQWLGQALSSTCFLANILSTQYQGQMQTAGYDLGIQQASLRKANHNKLQS